jgi:hypothetical protein
VLLCIPATANLTLLLVLLRCRTNGEGAGGIYHENAHDTPWGKAWAFWKKEVSLELQGANGGRGEGHWD